MPTLKASSVEYKFDLSEIKRMIARDLEVPEKAVTVHYDLRDTSDDRYGYSPSYNVVSITATVDNTKIDG